MVIIFPWNHPSSALQKSKLPILFIFHSTTNSLHLPSFTGNRSLSHSSFIPPSFQTLPSLQQTTILTFCLLSLDQFNACCLYNISASSLLLEGSKKHTIHFLPSCWNVICLPLYSLSLVFGV